MKDVTLSKGAFVLSHTGLNIRDEYLIGKIVGTGIHPAFLTYLGAFGEVRLCTHRKTGI